MYRQGDVILIPSTKTPSTRAKVITDQGRTILAYGEVTGHAHEVVAGAVIERREHVTETGVDDFGESFDSGDRVTTIVVPSKDNDPVPAQQLFEEPDGSRLLVCRVPCALQHEEHGAIALSGGTYEVRHQTEWTLDQARQVAD